MVRVRVHTILHLIPLLGGRKVVLELPDDSSVTDLLLLLGERMGRGDDLLAEQREAGPARQFSMSINGRSLAALNGLETALADGDEVLLLPPIGGG